MVTLGLRNHNRFPETVEVVSTEEGFAALCSVWGQLFENAAYASPFASWDWAWEWWQSLAKPLQSKQRQPRLHILVARSSSNEVIGIAPLYEVSTHARFLGARGLLPFGFIPHVEGMTEEPTVLLHRDHEAKALTSILSHLTAPTFRRWNQFCLPVLCTLSYSPRRQQAAGARFRLKAEQNYDGPQVVSLPQSWDEFRQGLSRSMRDNLAYYPHKLVRHHHAWRVRYLREPGDMVEGSLLFTGMHLDRTLDEQRVSHCCHLPSLRHMEFLSRVLARLAQRQEAFIAVLEVDGEPIAAQVFLKSARRLTVYHSGFDPAWQAYSPLTMLLAEVIKESILQGDTQVNFLTSAAPWKTRWGAREEMPIQRLTGILPHGMFAARNVLSRWKGQVRQLPSNFGKPALVIRELCHETFARFRPVTGKPA